MRKIIKLIILTFILTLLLLTITACSNKPEKVLKEGKFGKTTVFLEIADSNIERTYGLMFRESLKEDHGMLFIFEDEKPRSFWMKNTLIPLNIIFLTKNFEVINIQKAIPCKADPCPNYLSEGPAKYVVEFNLGFSEKNNIEKGTKLILKK